ncbi:MAG: elongation factor Ts [Patescibacteria group bacterium]|nr:elongation factor Ts [Patescibacteria group bacterium]
MEFNLIKQLKEKTGAGFQDCQRALAETKGDLVKAEEVLRKRGQKIIASKTNRLTKSGIIGVYLHSNEKIAALVELTCETDFVARNKEFKELAHDLAMQVAATNPLYLRPEDIPHEIVEKEKEIYQAELAREKKPTKILEKIIEGKLEKFYETVCLLNQPFIKDEKIKIVDLIKNKIAKLRENIQIKRFIRFEI